LQQIAISKICKQPHKYALFNFYLLPLKAEIRVRIPVSLPTSRKANKNAKWALGLRFQKAGLRFHKADEIRLEPTCGGCDNFRRGAIQRDK
jgi:hypothetical protein